MQRGTTEALQANDRQEGTFPQSSSPQTQKYQRKTHRQSCEDNGFSFLMLLRQFFHRPRLPDPNSSRFDPIRSESARFNSSAGSLPTTYTRSRRSQPCPVRRPVDIVIFDPILFDPTRSDPTYLSRPDSILPDLPTTKSSTKASSACRLYVY